jgi:TusA-related sulfurtransferase
MYDELRYSNVVDGINILIDQGASIKKIPRWVRFVDYTLTAIYLSTYVGIAIYILTLVI